MLTIYGRATSSNVQLVMWAVGEIELDHERLNYGEMYGGLDTPDYLALNPHGRVPTLRDGDLVIWESAAILRYLAARYGTEGFWPKDPAARAGIDMWAEWGKITLSNAFTVPIFWARVRTPAAKRNQRALSAAVARFDGLLIRLANQLGDNPFVCGAGLTAADIVIGHVLFRWFTMDIRRAPNPVVEAYYARLTERPAYRTHVMVNYDILRVAGA